MFSKIKSFWCNSNMTHDSLPHDARRQCAESRTEGCFKRACHSSSLGAQVSTSWPSFRLAITTSSPAPCAAPQWRPTPTVSRSSDTSFSDQSPEAPSPDERSFFVIFITISELSVSSTGTTRCTIPRVTATDKKRKAIRLVLLNHTGAVLALEAS